MYMVLGVPGPGLLGAALGSTTVTLRFRGYSASRMTSCAANLSTTFYMNIIYLCYFRYSHPRSLYSHPRSLHSNPRSRRSLSPSLWAHYSGLHPISRRSLWETGENPRFFKNSTTVKQQLRALTNHRSTQNNTNTTSARSDCTDLSYVGREGASPWRAREKNRQRRLLNRPPLSARPRRKPVAYDSRFAHGTF
jgi:hypothetical protein